MNMERIDILTLGTAIKDKTLFLHCGWKAKITIE